MNIHDLEFPAVVKFSPKNGNYGTTFIMYNPTSAVVIRCESESMYTVGQVVEGRIGFRNIEDVTVEKINFENTVYYKELEDLIKKKEHELNVMKFVLSGAK